MSQLTVCLWFDDQAEIAADFYVEAFKACGRSASKGRIAHRTDENGQAAVLTVEFDLDGQTVLGLNGGPLFTFSPATSLIVRCTDQDEIDRFWTALSSGGATSRCGWLTDRFGFSWQVVPADIGDLITGDAARSARVMAAVMTMDKLDIAALRRAADG